MSGIDIEFLAKAGPSAARALFYVSASRDDAATMHRLIEQHSVDGTDDVLVRTAFGLAAGRHRYRALKLLSRLRPADYQWPDEAIPGALTACTQANDIELTYDLAVVSDVSALPATLAQIALETAHSTEAYETLDYLRDLALGIEPVDEPEPEPETQGPEFQF